MAKDREPARRTRLPADRAKIPNGEYAGLIEVDPTHVRAIEKWQLKPEQFKHDWQHQLGQRDRWTAFYPVTVLWGVDRDPSTPQNRALRALAASQGDLVTLPLAAGYFTRPKATKALQPARQSMLYKLLRWTRAARMPGAALLVPEEIDFRAPVGLYYEFKVSATSMDEDRDPVSEDSHLAYSMVRKILRASLIPPCTPLEEAVLAVIGHRKSTIDNRQSTYQGSMGVKTRSYENEPVTADGPTVVGVDRAAESCDLLRAVVVPTTLGDGKTGGFTAGPTRAAGAPASAAPRAGLTVLTPLAPRLDPEEAKAYFRHHFGAGWMARTVTAGPCPKCGETTRRRDGEAAWCPRCK